MKVSFEYNFEVLNDTEIRINGKRTDSFGAGEMVLESTGKETLPLSNENYMTYRYAVDKDCNIKLYKVYDEVD